MGTATKIKPPSDRGVWPTDMIRGEQYALLFFNSYMGLERSTFSNTNAVLGVGASICVCDFQLYLVGRRLGLHRK